MPATPEFNKKADFPAACALAEDAGILFLEACENGDLVQVKSVLKACPPAANLTDAAGQSALQLATSWANTETVALLLKYGANIAYQDRQGQTAQDLANRLGYHSIAALIDDEGQARAAATAEHLRRRELALFTKGLPVSTAVRPRPIRFK